MIVSQP